MPMMLSSVDLPQPDGPMIAVNSPAAIPRSTSLSAVVSTSAARKTFERFCMTSIGIPSSSPARSMAEQLTGPDRYSLYKQSIGTSPCLEPAIGYTRCPLAYTPDLSTGRLPRMSSRSAEFSSSTTTPACSRPHGCCSSGTSPSCKPNPIPSGCPSSCARASTWCCST